MTNDREVPGGADEPGRFARVGGPGQQAREHLEMPVLGPNQRQIGADHADGVHAHVSREQAAQTGNDGDAFRPQRVGRRPPRRSLDLQPLHVQARPARADALDLARRPEGFDHLALQEDDRCLEADDPARDEKGEDHQRDQPPPPFAFSGTHETRWLRKESNVNVHVAEVRRAVRGAYPSTTSTQCSEPSSNKGKSAPPENRLPSRLTRDTPRQTPFGFSTRIR
jgi:hypothetical protein